MTDSWNEAHCLSNLHSLCSSSGAEFVKEPTRVGLDCVLADEQFLRNFAITQPIGNKLKDFEFSGCHAEFVQFLLVQFEVGADGDRHLFYHDGLFVTGQFEPKPDTQSGKQRRNESAVDFKRMLDNQEPVLN